MKGPYERLKYDLRRLWECPQCHKRERTDGTVTFRFCSCQARSDSGQPIPMKLLEESGHRTVPPIVPRIPEELPAILAAAEPLAEALAAEQATEAAIDADKPASSPPS